MEDSLLSSATPPRPGTAPGQTGAGAKKLRAMSPDLFGTGKPPPRPQTAGGRKVSISDVVEEQDFDKVTGWYPCHEGGGLLACLTARMHMGYKPASSPARPGEVTSAGDTAVYPPEENRPH